jgi:Outer membrane protein/protective antigen OMA87
VKLSERVYLPSNRLRGFERGKIGPKDGNDFIGGNYAVSLNFTSNIPKILENSESTDFNVFLDIGNVWGVDYNNSLETADDIKSAIGIGIDWFSPVGPMNFSLTQPLTKSSTDITESFRFNLGTTF